MILSLLVHYQQWEFPWSPNRFLGYNCLSDRSNKMRQWIFTNIFNHAITAVAYGFYSTPCLFELQTEKAIWFLLRYVTSSRTSLFVMIAVGIFLRWLHGAWTFICFFYASILTISDMRQFAVFQHRSTPLAAWAFGYGKHITKSTSDSW